MLSPRLAPSSEPLAYLERRVPDFREERVPEAREESEEDDSSDASRPRKRVDLDDFEPPRSVHPLMVRFYSKGFLERVVLTTRVREALSLSLEVDVSSVFWRATDRTRAQLASFFLSSSLRYVRISDIYALETSCVEFLESIHETQK